MALRELCIHLTRQCNQRCEHCYYNSGPEVNSYMPLNLAKDLIRQASKAGVKRVTLQGGEPFLYQGLEELCAFSKNLGLIVAIPTNGLLIDSSIISWLKKYVDIIFISIHGNKDFHDRFVGHSGAYQIAIKNIEECCNSGVKLGVLSSVSINNVNYIGEQSKIFDKLGVLIHGIIFHSEVGRGSQIKSLEMNDWEYFKEEMKKVQKSLKHMRIRFESLRQPLAIIENGRHKTCSCLGLEKHICFVDTEGWIYPCSLAMNLPELCYGHISKRTIRDYFQEIDWKWGYSHSPLNDECKSCKYLSKCHGGCMVKRFMGAERYCDDGSFLPTCVLYPDIDVYEEMEGTLI